MNRATEGHTDDDVVELSLGDRAALALDAYRIGATAPLADLVREVTPLLWHVVRAQGVPRDAAEDVVQGVWLAFVRRTDAIREPQATLKWLLVTARRAAWQAAKKGRTDAQRTAALPENIGELPAAGPGPDDVVLADERHRVLWRRFRELPERCQQILRFVAVADRPNYQAIAEATGVGVTSVGTTRGRCLTKLRELLESDERWVGT